METPDQRDRQQQSAPAGTREEMRQEVGEPARRNPDEERQNQAPGQYQRQGEPGMADPSGQNAERPVQYERRAPGGTEPHEVGSQGRQQAPQAQGNGSFQGSNEQEEGLLPYHEAEGYKRRWESIQASFVDDPRGCCEQADALVIEILDRMTQIRQEHRSQLRSSLEQGGDDTEGLRQAMQHYRSFFGGLLRA